MKSQKYEEAAKLRDDEKRIAGRFGKSSRTMGRRKLKTNDILVTEEDVAEVVTMMTGIPVKRMVQAESDKLAKLPE